MVGYQLDDEPNLYFNKWLEITNHLFINGCLGLQVFISTCFRFLVKSYEARSMIPQSQFVVWRGFIVFLVFFRRIFIGLRVLEQKNTLGRRNIHFSRSSTRSMDSLKQVSFFHFFFPPQKKVAVRTGVVLA